MTAMLAFNLLGVIAVGLSQRNDGLQLDDGRTKAIPAKPASMRDRDEIPGVKRDGTGKASAVAAVKPASLIMQPTQRTTEYTFKGISTDADKNFCRHITTYIHPDEYTGFGAQRTEGVCSEQGPASCDTTYHKPAAGKFVFCQTKSTGECEDGVTHECPWTFFMEDMIKEQTSQSKSCHSDMLEAKRSLDGLLHAIEDVYARIQTEETVITYYNSTIREQLVKQQRYWSEYLDDQHACDGPHNDEQNDLEDLLQDIATMREIANPAIRSAIDFDEEGGSTKGWQNPDSSLLEKKPEVQLCEVYSSLVERVEKRTGVQLEQPRDCDTTRADLQTLINESYTNLVNQYNSVIERGGLVFAECLTNATYKYRIRVEGPLGVDEAIQEAASRIHESQARLARLEPMLHDVEHATVRVRDYLSELNTTCALDADATQSLQDVQTLIRQLEECPGRNDFVLSVPHVTFGEPATTPSPTPWAARDISQEGPGAALDALVH